MGKFNIKNQISKLLVFDGVTALAIAGTSWVALLASRGFSTAEIGLLESIYHVFSMIFEVPSGAVADVFGRKKTLALSRVFAILSAIVMVLSNSFLTIALAMLFCALGNNLISGTREALAYDSLKLGGKQEDYLRYSSSDLIVSQLCGSAAILMAGLALYLGYQKAYIIDVLISFLALAIALSMREVPAEGHENMKNRTRFREVFIESVRFLKESKRARTIIVIAAFFDSVVTLLGMFMQAALPGAGLPEFLLGPALFVMGLGSVIGAKAVTLFKIKSYRKVTMIAAAAALMNLGTALSGIPAVMVAGCFLCGIVDSYYYVCTDTVLNDMIPSGQRATLVSVNSLAFSIVMIVMSPLVGFVFK